jgi:hypothetical protein
LEILAIFFSQVLPLASNQCKCCVKIQNDRSDPFETRQGLRQGDVRIINVVLEAKVLRAKLQTTGTTFNKPPTQVLAYADDIDIVSRSLKAVHDAYLALEAKAAKVGLKINKQKTKYMIAAGNWTIHDAGQTVAFGDKSFEVVDELMYLRAIVTPKNDQTTNRCYCGDLTYSTSDKGQRSTL